MSNNTFMKVEEVAEILGISKSYAYKIVQKVNDELKEKGFLTMADTLIGESITNRIGHEPRTELQNSARGSTV